jgi:HPt (histidine-containing phosphotransfer) domain-containing protein
MGLHRKGMAAEMGENRGHERQNAHQQADRLLISAFLYDAEKTIAVLEEICEKQGVLTDEDFKMFTVGVHGIKNALAAIGENALSDAAFALETAGRQRDADRVAAVAPAFLRRLKETAETLAPLKNDGGIYDKQTLCRKLLAFQMACAVDDAQAAGVVFESLKRDTWPDPIRERLDDMEPCILCGDYDQALEIAERTVRMVL